jgi:PPOX class probable F420-dependent enzyme
MSGIASAIHSALRARQGLNEQARQILDRRLYAVLGTENDDRTVHLAPVMFLLDGTRILIETSTASRKARNLAARPQASVVVHTADAAWSFGSGPATITRGAEARRLNERIRAKYLTDRGQRACGDLLGELDDITIVVTPTRWLSWDMNELLSGIAARGADLDEIDDWFRADT